MAASLEPNIGDGGGSAVMASVSVMETRPIAGKAERVYSAETQKKSSRVS